MNGLGRNSSLVLFRKVMLCGAVLFTGGQGVLVLSSVYLDDSRLEATISISCPNLKFEVDISCSWASCFLSLFLSFFPCILPFANLM